MYGVFWCVGAHANARMRLEWSRQTRSSAVSILLILLIVVPKGFAAHQNLGQWLCERPIHYSRAGQRKSVKNLASEWFEPEDSYR